MPWTTSLQGLARNPSGAVFALLVALSVVVALLVAVKKKRERPYFTPILTKREEAMFERLVDAFPNHAILAQISFGALLGARTRAVRNRFDRKRADFAICDKRTAKVLVLIELDDSSHRGREAQDAARDKMLTDAGYVVRRYPNIPHASELQRDMRKVLAGRR